MPVIRVTWFNDKSDSVKAEVAAEFTRVLAEKTGMDSQWIHVVFENVSPCDWAVAGELFARSGQQRNEDPA